MSDAVLARPGAARFSLAGSPTVFLCLVGVLLPNALSVGALALGIGVPPRTAMIIAYATLAVAARILSPAVVVPAFLFAVAYDAVSTVALLFNLAPSEIGTALHLVRELNLLKSPFYITLIAALTAAVGANVLLLVKRRAVLQQGNAALMMGVAVVFAVADFAANTSPHYHFGTLFSAGKPMESAADSSGFRRAVLANRDRSALLVMVEAMGEFADPAHRVLLKDALATPEVLSRYSVTTGSTTYFGSTTAAEMRELCANRKPYQALVEAKDFSCLPEQLSERGYRTMAMHNFTSAFFDRWQWYPKLGFAQSYFMQDLPGTYRQCGGPFRGPCDTEVVPFIEQKMRDGAQPAFFYWMTLSTHVPIAPREGTPRLDCEKNGGRIGQREVCYMAEMWIDLMARLAKLAIDMPGTEIMIVGDHGPPLWPRAGRAVFEPGKVPWFRLTPKARVADAGR